MYALITEVLTESERNDLAVICSSAAEDAH